MVRTPSNQTKVSRAKPETTSVRTTIPAHIAAKLDLNVGDDLDWDIDKINGKWVAIFSKTNAEATRTPMR
ncbi:MAG: hypothetical protein OXK17_10385 [Thaumarchaeota archaeon]|nr:hypothetical protein [Nitrososphaerota archaeon]